MKEHIIGVDIGGTKTAAGLISRDGVLARSVAVPTLAGKGFKSSLAQVFTAIEEILSAPGVRRSSIKGIGLCAPGPLDPEKGVVHNPPNLPGWKEVDLVSVVKKKFGIAARLENDANAAAIAEMVWGAARGFDNIFYVTVSTGIGTGIIINGKIYHGKNGMAGEGGHMTINYDEKKAVCGCGQRGCAEALASGSYTESRVRELLKKSPRTRTKILKLAEGDIDKIDMRIIAKAARQKDTLALKTIEEQGTLLGIWLGSMISLLDPDMIVIGGGVSMIGELIFRHIRKHAYNSTINGFARHTPIVRAGLKKHSGVFGAASIFMQK